MARDVMTIRLHLRRIRVVDVLVDTISPPCGGGRVDLVGVALSVVWVQDQVGA